VLTAGGGVANRSSMQLMDLTMLAVRQRWRLVACFWCCVACKIKVPTSRSAAHRGSPWTVIEYAYAYDVFDGSAKQRTFIDLKLVYGSGGWNGGSLSLVWLALGALGKNDTTQIAF
jgi:hypothetical protein